MKSTGRMPPAWDLKDGDSAILSSPYGEIRMKVKVTSKIKPGVILTVPGYTEANVNDLIGRDHLDPYSGFPGYKGMRCNISKSQEAEGMKHVFVFDEDRCCACSACMIGCMDQNDVDLAAGEACFRKDFR